MSGPVEYRDGPNMHIEADLPTFDTVEPKAVEWLWPGRIALGKLTLMVGDPGLGKSLIGLALLTHVSRGAPWPGARTSMHCPFTRLWSCPLLRSMRA